MNVRLFQIGTLILATGVTVVGFQNCAGQGKIASTSAASAADPVAMEKSMNDLESQIKQLSARDLACDTDADCTVVPVGASHCGGPTFLVLNSKISGDFGTVKELAQSFRQVESNYLKSNNLVRSCDMLMAPAASCVAHQCSVP